MKIAIDLRSLTSGNVTGVENYTLNLLAPLLAGDKKNTYTLFYNSFSRAPVGEFHFINSQVKHTRIPNKILNLGLKTGTIKLEKLTGEFDCLFMPNLNQFNISPTAKLAITVHDMSPVVTPEFYDLKRHIWHKFLNYKKAFKRASVIFAVSEYTKQDIVRLFDIDEKKITVVYPGIDHSVFKPDIELSELRRVRNTYSLPGDYILFLNTIEPRKNLVNLIKAFDALDNPAELVIAGRQGWKYADIFRQIRKAKRHAKIHYIGYVPEQDKPSFIKMARVLAYPSFYEGFGFQPLEAMAMGVPTVVSQVTALPEIVGDASLLINPYNSDSIVWGLNETLNNENLRKMLIEKGLKQAQKYNWETSAETVLRGINSME